MTTDWIDDAIADISLEFNGLDDYRARVIRNAIESNLPTQRLTDSSERRQNAPWVGLLLHNAQTMAKRITDPDQPVRYALTLDELRALINRYVPIAKPQALPWVRRLWDELHIPGRVTVVGPCAGRRSREMALIVTYDELESALMRHCPDAVKLEAQNSSFRDRLGYPMEQTA